MKTLIPAGLLYQLKLPFKRMAYELMDQLVIHFVPKGCEGGLLLFRLDLLGDYLMCRPFFEAFRKDQPFGETRFFFTGNQLLQALAEELNPGLFDEFIPIDRSRFINSLIYRFQILAAIRRRGFSTIINPMHTRQFWLESVVRVSGAERRLGASATGKYMNGWEQQLSDSWYSRIFPTGSEPSFEFFRNRSFFSRLCPSAEAVSSLRRPDHPQVKNPNLILLAPGASTQERRWPAASFALLMNQLATAFPASRFGLVGSADEEILCREIAGFLPELQPEIHAGKLSLPESLKLIAEAALLIANESGSVHLAATAGTACVCISNGNHFGRWNPYPESLAPNILTCYPENFYPLVEKIPWLLAAYHNRSELPASLVENERVQRACMQLLGVQARA